MGGRASPLLWVAFRFWLCYVEPFLLLPALEAELNQLDALGGFEQVPAEGALAGDVLEEELPLHLEGVVVVLAAEFLPALEEVDRLRDVWIPDRLGRLRVRLRVALA